MSNVGHARPDNLAYESPVVESVDDMSAANLASQILALATRPKNCSEICAMLFAGQPTVLCIYAYCMKPFALLDYYDGRQELEAVSYKHFDQQYVMRQVESGGYIVERGIANRDNIAVLDLLVENCAFRLVRETAQRELYATLNSLSHGTRTPLTAIIDELSKGADEQLAKQCLQLTSTLVDFIEFHKQTIDPRNTLTPCTMADLATAWTDANSGICVTHDGHTDSLIMALDIYRRVAWNIASTALETHGSQLSIDVEIRVVEDGSVATELETIIMFNEMLDIDLSELYGAAATRLAVPLGIHLAARLLASVGGAVRLPEQRQTSTLTLVMPIICKSGEVISMLSSVPKPMPTKPTILLAEDNEINRRAIQRILNSANLDVSVACDGREALEQLKKTTFDIALLDIKMPGLDGYQVATYVRQLDHVPILIACTAQLIARRDDDLFDYCIQKPVKRDVLLGLLRKIGIAV